jgi:hypothetical protein
MPKMIALLICIMPLRQLKNGFVGILIRATFSPIGQFCNRLGQFTISNKGFNVLFVHCFIFKVVKIFKQQR